MKKIPSLSEPGVFAELNIRNSKFIEIKTNSLFEVRMQYPLLKMQNAEERCFVRNEVYEKLIYAHGLLPRGYRFLILDAWRPFKLQKELYSKYSKDIITRYGLEKYDKTDKEQIVKKYVSVPVDNRRIPPVHTTGGAVDLTIIDSNDVELNMGCGFDEFEDVAHTAYFEESNSLIVKDNRRLLYWTMIKAGFTNLPSEWWHYDYGDSFWGFYNRCPAIYAGCFSAEELIYEK